MQQFKLDGQAFKRMFLGGVAGLNANKQEINDLNVFPVPDGDTGTNMVLTMQAAAQELNKVTDNSINSMVKSVSMGSLMGARGNSGVILSQLFRGFARGLEGKQEVDAMEFARALQEGADSAYRAVLKPVEGTMLTVARDGAKAALSAAREFNEFFFVLDNLVRHSLESVKRTPSLLPVLKQAGVVDAGGKGIYYIYLGFLNALIDPNYYAALEEATQEGRPVKPGSPGLAEFDEIKYGYCTELILKGENLSADELKEELSPLGDSLLVVGEADLLKIHVHTNNPGKVLEICAGLGTMHKIKIDNMREQHSETLWAAAEEAQSSDADGIGVISVASGDGFKEMFVSLGVDAVIEGGQTMNPSTEDILREIKKLKAGKIILLPNNKNIIMAAEQAKKLSDKEVEVVPSKTLPQGMAALLSLNKVEFNLAENAKKMRDALGNVKTGQITMAVRDSQYNGYEITRGDFIGMNNGDLTVVNKTLEGALFDLLENMVDSEKDEIITFYTGKDITLDETRALIQKVQAKYGSLEVEVYNGGQPLYHFIIGVE
ncbi:MAG TPA: DAK2 domain-containing protein [Firmicutes bacterium]|nr:DAK2 domain-containing protein [Bacillota bacterium]